MGVACKNRIHVRVIGVSCIGLYALGLSCIILPRLCPGNTCAALCGTYPIHIKTMIQLLHVLLYILLCSSLVQSREEKKECVCSPGKVSLESGLVRRWLTRFLRSSLTSTPSGNDRLFCRVYIVIYIYTVLRVYIRTMCSTGFKCIVLDYMYPGTCTSTCICTWKFLSNYTCTPIRVLAQSHIPVHAITL